QLGTTKPFEEAVPRAVLERKVLTYLEQSVALETIRHTPVTAEMLGQEQFRIERDTRFPERLQELYAALGSDSVLVQECLIRPVLVGRMTRGLAVTDGLPVLNVPVTARPGPLMAGTTATTSTCIPLDTWSPGILDDSPAPRIGAAAVWTGSLMLVLSG